MSNCKFCGKPVKCEEVWHAACAETKDTLTELMDIAAARAGDVLQMAYRINLHLFGIEDHEPDDKTEPTCLRDVLCAEMALLNKTAEELAKLMEKLGC